MEHVNPHTDIYNVLARYVPASQMDTLLQELREVNSFWDTIHHSTDYIIKRLGEYHTTITSYPGGSVGARSSPSGETAEDIGAAVYVLLTKYISPPVLEVFANELRSLLLHRYRRGVPSITPSAPSEPPPHSAPPQVDAPPPLPPEPAREGISISDSSVCFWCKAGYDRMMGKCECA